MDRHPTRSSRPAPRPTAPAPSGAAGRRSRTSHGLAGAVGLIVASAALAASAIAHDQGRQRLIRRPVAAAGTAAVGVQAITTPVAAVIAAPVASAITARPASAVDAPVVTAAAFPAPTAAAIATEAAPAVPTADAAPPAAPRAAPAPRAATPDGRPGRSAPHRDGFQQRGLASWYGSAFHGRQTATGERFDMHALTAAHLSLPLRSWVRVTNLSNGRSVVVRVNDRGPYVGRRILDLSLAAARRIDLVHGGVGRVQIDTVGSPDADAALAGTHGGGARRAG